MNWINLSNQMKLPQIGLGTWQVGEWDDEDSRTLFEKSDKAQHKRIIL